MDDKKRFDKILNSGGGEFMKRLNRATAARDKLYRAEYKNELRNFLENYKTKSCNISNLIQRRRFVKDENRSANLAQR